MAKSRILSCAVTLVLAIGPWLIPAAASAEDVTARYFQELRNRQLFSLAEGYCLQRLAEPTVSAQQRAQLTLELSRTLVEHAKHVGQDERADLWQRAREVVATFLENWPDHSDRLRFQVQAAFIPAAQAESLRWQSELQPFDEELKQRGLELLEEATADLIELERSLDEAVSRVRSRPGGARNGPLTPYELRTLWYNVRYRLGAAMIDRAKLLPDDSPDRMGALLDAEQWLRQLATGFSGDDLTWQSRILLVESTRLRGDLPRAASMLEAMATEEPPAGLKEQMVAERARLLLAQNKPTEAADAIVEFRRSQPRLSGELSFLIVQALVASRDIARGKNDSALAEELLGQIEAIAERTQQDVGGYWGYRCGQLVELLKESRNLGRELAVLIRRARDLYAAGRIDECLAAYDDATAEARRQGNEAKAFELGYMRASIQWQDRQYQDAADSFHELVRQFPDSRGAAKAHILWAYCLGKLYEEQRTESRRLAYTDALEEHRERFAREATAAEATWMLAQFQERRLQVTKALELYEAIGAETPRGPAAQVAVARCYEWVLARLRELKQPVDEWEQRAVDRLQNIVATYPGRGRLTIQQAEVALRLARILLNRHAPTYEEADRLLGRIFASRAKPSDADSANPRATETEATSDGDSWQTLLQSANQLRIVSLASQNRTAEAEKLVDQLAHDDPLDVLSVLNGLTQLAAHADERSRRELGELQLQTAEKLSGRRDELDAAGQRKFNRCLAEAYVATHQPQKAMDVYRQLLEAAPRDRDVAQMLARLLSECGTPECLKEAKSRWRALEGLEQAGSVAWLKARYQVALCSFRLKEYEECRKLIGVTRLLYPDLGHDETLRKDFADLQRKAERFVKR